MQLQSGARSFLSYRRLAHLQEKQKRHHAWPSDQHRPDGLKQGAQDDAACLAAFCATRSDTAHLAPCFVTLAKQPQALSALAIDVYTSDSHDNITASQSMVIGDDGRGYGEGDDLHRASGHLPAHDSWQHQLIEAMDELAEKFQALLSLQPAQVGVATGICLSSGFHL